MGKQKLGHFPDSDIKPNMSYEKYTMNKDQRSAKQRVVVKALIYR